MTTRSNGPLAGFDWLKRGINVGYGNPKALFGGGAFLLLACVLPALIRLPIQFEALRAGLSINPTTIGCLMAASALVGLLVVPLYAGYLRVIDASERGLPTRARDVFQPYRHGDALRLVGYGLAMLCLYFAMFGAALLATGGGVLRWYLQMLSAQLNHQVPVVTPPDGFGATFALFAVLAVFMMGVHSISLGQIALGGRSVFGAIKDGLSGALKNVLPLLVFVVSLLLALILLVILIVLLAGLLTLLGKLVGTWLVLLLVVPLYVGAMVAMCAIMFGMTYYLWRDVCGSDDNLPAVAQSITA